MQCKYCQIILEWTCEWLSWRVGHFIEVAFKTGSTILIKTESFQGVSKQAMLYPMQRKNNPNF